MSTNRLFIAAAGSGKTTFIVNEALSCKSERVLITTFTIANAQSIREKILKENNGIIPANVTIQTWFSFLLEHGVRPYRFWDECVMGVCLVNQISTKWISECKPDGTLNPQYYFDSNIDVYSDKLSKLVIRCNEKSAGYVIKRLEKIYRRIYIDEIQDMGGYDLEIIKLFMKSSLYLTMVGDPRQSVYMTHPDKKHEKYNNGKIKEFIQTECKKIPLTIDDTTLNCSYRNSKEICALSAKLYPSLPQCESRLKNTATHMGIFFVKISDIEQYISSLNNVVQLRYNKKESRTILKTDIMNFGISKGLEFYHVLIYPTKPILKWLLNNQSEFAESSRAEFYVALTRASFSVGIVVDDNFKKTVEGITMWTK
jgi:DNA helicase-2/ATP-dependent DNA helicase PcrA